MSKILDQLIARSLCAALLFMAIPVNSALAATYEIKLFARGGGTAGTGGFQFDNNAGVGCLTTTTPDVMINGVNLSTASTTDAFCVDVVSLSFNDGKESEPGGANILTGEFVEGLGGTLEDGTGNSITFSLTVNGSDPNNFIRVYRGVVGGQPVGGTYAVSNLASIPEPGVLALFGFGLGALAWISRRKQRQC